MVHIYKRWGQNFVGQIPFWRYDFKRKTEVRTTFRPWGQLFKNINIWEQIQEKQEHIQLEGWIHANISSRRPNLRHPPYSLDLTAKNNYHFCSLQRRWKTIDCQEHVSQTDKHFFLFKLIYILCYLMKIKWLEVIYDSI